MKNSNWRFFRKIFMFFCLIVFIFGLFVLYGFRLEPVKKEVKTKTETFANPAAEIPVDSTTEVNKIAQSTPDAGTIEITKSGLLGGDHAKLSLYYIDGSTKTYISPSPQIVADGGKVTWTGLALGKIYYIEEDFSKIENTHTYNVTNPVAEIPIDSSAKEERTVQNIPNPTTEIPVNSATTDEKKLQDALGNAIVVSAPVAGETYIILHGSTIIEGMMANPGGTAEVLGFIWYILLTVKEEIASSGYEYILNPIIYKPATFSPIMTTISFSLQSGTSVQPATQESIRVLTFTYMNWIILISAVSAVIGALAMLIASLRRRRYKRWNHAYGINRNFNQD